MINDDDLAREFYTPLEVSEMLKVGYFNIYRKIQNGEIEATRIGRKWLIPAKVLTKYLNKNS